MIKEVLNKVLNVLKGEKETIFDSSSFMTNIDFFLSDKIKVDSLQSGAIENGGATKIGSYIYSNVEGDNNIRVNNKKNTISLFVPSTIDVNSNVDNALYVKKYYDMIDKYFNKKDIVIHNANGSWYSEDMNKVVIENITIIEVSTKKLNKMDIEFMLQLGIDVKKEMSQEGVSISINSALAIV